MYRILYKNLPIISLLSVFFLTSCAQQSATRQDFNLVNLGNTAYEKQEYETALTYYRQAIQTEPSVAAYEGLAQSLEATGNWKEAAKIWAAITKVETITPDQANKFRLKAAKNHARLGQSMRATEFLNALENSEILMSREGLLVTGLVSVLEGEEKRAITAFETILTQNSKDVSAKNNLALTYLVFDKPDTAIKLFDEIGDNSSVGINTAISLVLLDKEEEAYELVKELQGSEVAKQTVEFAQDLSYMPPSARARYLFGIE